MKKRDVILMGTILLLSLAVWIGIRLFRSQSGEFLQIVVAGEVYGRYPLSEDRTIEIGSSNVCRIQDGMVTMTTADCPDHLCLRQHPISADRSGTIVCLPNRVVLEIDGPDVETDPDVIAS